MGITKRNSEDNRGAQREAKPEKESKKEKRKTKAEDQCRRTNLITNKEYVSIILLQVLLCHKMQRRAPRDS